MCKELYTIIAKITVALPITDNNIIPVNIPILYISDIFKYCGVCVMFILMVVVEIAKLVFFWNKNSRVEDMILHKI